MFNVPNAIFDAFRMETAVQLSTNDIQEIDPLMQGLMKACHSHLRGITTRFCCSGHDIDEQRIKYAETNDTLEGFTPSRHQEAEIIFAVKEDNANFLLEAFAAWSTSMNTQDHLKLHPSIKILRLMNGRSLSSGPYYAIKVELFYRLDFISPSMAVDELNNYCRIVYDFQNVGKNVSPFPTNCSSIPGVTNPQQAHFQRQFTIPLGKPIREGYLYINDNGFAKPVNKESYLARVLSLAFYEGTLFFPSSFFLPSEWSLVVNEPSHPYNVYRERWLKQPSDVRDERILAFALLPDDLRAPIIRIARSFINLPDEHMENMSVGKDLSPSNVLEKLSYLISGMGKGPDEIEEEEKTVRGKLLKQLWESMPLVDQVTYFNKIRERHNLPPFVYVDCENFDKWLEGATTAEILAEKVKQSVLANKHR